MKPVRQLLCSCKGWMRGRGGDACEQTVRANFLGSLVAQRTDATGGVDRCIPSRDPEPFSVYLTTVVLLHTPLHYVQSLPFSVQIILQVFNKQDKSFFDKTYIWYS